jgi:hypothetical protein
MRMLLWSHDKKKKETVAYLQSADTPLPLRHFATHSEALFL